MCVGRRRCLTRLESPAAQLHVTTFVAAKACELSPPCARLLSKAKVESVCCNFLLPKRAYILKVATEVRILELFSQLYAPIKTGVINAFPESKLKFNICALPSPIPFRAQQKSGITGMML